jgi:hypothetical protein
MTRWPRPLGSPPRALVAADILLPAQPQAAPTPWVWASPEPPTLDLATLLREQPRQPQRIGPVSPHAWPGLVALLRAKLEPVD